VLDLLLLLQALLCFLATRAWGKRPFDDVQLAGCWFK
jgi:hypothetical protein